MNEPIEPLLEISQLSVEFAGRRESHRALENVGFQLARGETFGLVGESASGKTLTALAILRLLPAGARMVSGEILYDGTDLRQITEGQMHRIRGREIGIVFQDPLTALNPVMRIDTQLSEGMIYHLAYSKQEASLRGKRLLREVGIPDPDQCLRSYPHQLSGGMRQRVLIASALSCQPKLLICDEITSALDTVTQAQLLTLLDRLKKALDLSILFISHDLRAVSQIADRVAVMRNGRILEEGSAADVFERPVNSYTRNLMRSYAGICDGDLRN